METGQGGEGKSKKKQKKKTKDREKHETRGLFRQPSSGTHFRDVQRGLTQVCAGQKLHQ